MRKYLRDPITHFILIGLVLVAINHFWSAYQGEQGRTIVVSEAELDRLGKIWANSTGRLPTGEDRQAIIDQFVEEEVLVREASRLGLGADDTIIRRRLAQKMDFLTREEAAPAMPADTELKSWFDNNRERFTAPERRSFSHIYFSPEKHGRALETIADNALSKVKSGADWKGLGDPFMQKRSYAVVPESEVTRLFGPEFARSVFNLKPGEWRGPLGSAFGLHLVKVEAVDESAAAEFNSIRGDVLTAWQDEQAAAARADALNDLVSGYTVVVEGEQ